MSLTARITSLAANCLTGPASSKSVYLVSVAAIFLASYAALGPVIGASTSFATMSDRLS